MENERSFRRKNCGRAGLRPAAEGWQAGAAHEGCQPPQKPKMEGRIPMKGKRGLPGGGAPAATGTKAEGMGRGGGPREGAKKGRRAHGKTGWGV